MLTLGEEQYLDEKWAATHQQMLAELGHETLCETSLLREMMSDHEWAYHAAPILAELEKSGVAYRSYWIANLVWVRGDYLLLEKLASRPDVAHIFTNSRVRMESPPGEETGLQALAPVEAQGVEWNIELVGAPDPALIATVFPGLNERLVAHIEPGADDDRIVDLDYCTNAYAIHHLEPIDDIVVREWAPDGTLAGATLLLGRLAKSAFATRAQDIPLLKPKVDELLARSGVLVNSHAYGETRAVFNYFPKRELLYSDVPSLKSIIDRMVYMAGDDDIAVTTRQGRGYAAALRYSRTPTDLVHEVDPGTDRLLVP